MSNVVIQVNWEEDIHCKDESTWLADFRKHHYEMFKGNGFPTGKDEYWKYTDLSLLANKKFNYVDCVEVHHKIDTETREKIVTLIDRHRIDAGEAALLVMIDGCFFADLSSLEDVSSGVLICSLKDALTNYNELVKKYWPGNVCVKKFPFACINAALFNDGIFIYVLEKCEVKQPIHILTISTCKNNNAIHPRNLIILDKDSSIKIYEEFITVPGNKCDSLMLNSGTSITLEKNSRLSYIKIQHDNPEIIHLSHSEVQQRENSNLNFCNFMFGAHFAREDIVVNLMDKHATANTCGFYQSGENTKYHDHHVLVNHVSPNTDSNMLFKGILHHDARAVFNGKVLVKPNANKTNAYQANHNLMMATAAEIYSKPELEIYANDVKCKHASTIGQFDPLALFYLRSRGIPSAEAKRMMVQSFAQEVIQYVDHDSLKSRIEKMV
jgi:Fe-S cluster assembly protein SufD